MQAREVHQSGDRKLEFILEFPMGSGPFPVLIMLPGLRYDMHRPAIALPSHYLLKKGFAVCRFNWKFYVEDAVNGQPSSDLSAECEEVKAVLAIVRAEERIDQGKISMAGKSLGSIVGWRIFKDDLQLKSYTLITPLCEAFAEGEHLSQVEENYPGFAQEKRPVLMMAGHQDPYCHLPTLYRFAARAAGNVRLAVLQGNHAIELKDATMSIDEAKIEAAFQRNMHLLGCHLENLLLE